MNKLQKFLAALVVILGIVVLKESGLAGNKSLPGYAQRIIAACRDETERSVCYDRQIPKLMETISMQDAFSVAKVIQREDQAYPYCHVLGHVLSAREAKKDLSKWKDVIVKCPSGICSNGCLHGAFQERFRSDILPSDRKAEIIPELETVCESRGSWTPTGLERASCYHAVGHLLMFITNADAAAATAYCDKISNKAESGDHRKVCYDGAFMQLYQPLEPEDSALIKGKEVTRAAHPVFCRKFEGLKRTTCVSEGWPLYFDSLREPGGLVALCSQLTGGAFLTCIDSVLYVLVVQFRFHLPSIKDYCLGMPENLIGRCFGMTASRLIETDYDNVDSAIDWCKSDPTDFCFGELVNESTFVFRKGTEMHKTFCQKLPAKFHADCLTHDPKSKGNHEIE